MDAAAISYVEREGRILCVWNRAHGTWALPGGKVEEHEDVHEAQRRELYEETGIARGVATLVHKASSSSGSGRSVYAFHVATEDVPEQRENDSPITWLTREELLVHSKWADYYRGLFASVDLYYGGSLSDPMEFGGPK